MAMKQGWDLFASPCLPDIPCCFTVLSLLLVASGMLNCSMDNCVLGKQALEKIDG